MPKLRYTQITVLKIEALEPDRRKTRPHIVVQNLTRVKCLGKLLPNGTDDDGMIAAGHPMVKSAAQIADFLIHCTSHDAPVVDRHLDCGIKCVTALETVGRDASFEQNFGYIQTNVNRLVAAIGMHPAFAGNCGTLEEMAAERSSGEG